MEQIGEKAFSNTGLKEVTFKGIHEPQCSNNVFYGSNEIEIFNVPEEYEDDDFCGIKDKIDTELIIIISTSIVISVVIILVIIIIIFMLFKHNKERKLQSLTTSTTNHKNNEMLQLI